MLATGNGASAFVGFITLLISTTYNSLETLGIYGTFIVSVAAFSQLVAGRLEHSIIRTQSKRSITEIKKAAYTVSLCMINIFIVSYGILILLDILNFNSKVIIILLAVLSSSWWNISIILLNYEQKYYEISLLLFIKSLLLLFTLGAVSITVDNPLLMCLAYLITDILALIFINRLGRLRIQIIYPNLYEYYLMLRVIKKNKDMILLSTPNYFLNQSSRLVFIYYIQAMFGDAAVGIVTTCERYLSLFSSTLGAAIGKVYNRDLTLNKANKSTNSHFVRYATLLAMSAFLLFSSTYLIIHVTMVPIMDSIKFKEIWVFSILMLPAVCIKFVAVPLSLTFINLHRTEIPLIFNIGYLVSVLLFLSATNYIGITLSVFILSYSLLVAVAYSFYIILAHMITRKFDKSS